MNLQDFDVEKFNDFEPASLQAIESDARIVGFEMSSLRLTGSLLRFLSATKPGGRMLEIGTGVGAGTSWILSGMDQASRLTTVEINSRFSEIAKMHLGGDPRVEFVVCDAMGFLREAAEERYDLIFADSPVGKLQAVSEVMRLLAPGGIYVGDDMTLEEDFPVEEYEIAAKVFNGLSDLVGRISVGMRWSSGIVMLTGKAGSAP